ncbi:ABC transporter substrate-binding protein [Candidatus Microgenomates bacterium]|nr:ABC transporter substrate-binding protein [Candidatus Microgenomates bacterium]
MRKVRFYSQVVSLFIKRFAFLIVLGVLLGGVFFLGGEKIFSAFGPLVKVERVGVLGQFTQNNLPLSITSAMSMGLTTLDTESKPQAGIAQNWEVKEEGRVWEFTIKKGLKWQDGSNVKAGDLIYNIPDVAASYPDDNHIIFQLPDPYAPFPVIVSRPIFKRNLLGVGRWEAKDVVGNSGNIRELVLAEISLPAQAGTGREIIYLFYPTENMMLSAFKLGEIDTILDFSDNKKLTGFNQLHVEADNHLDRFVGIFLNTEDTLLNDKSIRQALAYATNKTNLGGPDAPRALSSISPLSWAYNPLVKNYNYDAKHAKDLIKNKKDLSINLATIPSLLSVAEQIAAQWQAVGIKTNVQVASGVPEKFQALLATEIIPPDPDQYNMWHSTQTSSNITNYKNPRIDKLLEDGRRTLKQEERQKIYLDFQRFLVEDSPVIFLYHPVTYTISRK